MASERPVDRRVRILSTATRVFGEQGWFATRVDEIALRAGVSKALLLRHWPSKDALFLEIRLRLTERLRGRLEEGTRTSADPLDRIQATVACLGHFLIDHPGAWQILGPIRSSRAPAHPDLDQDALHQTVRQIGFRTPEWDSPVALTAEIGAIGLVAGAAHATSAEPDLDTELAMTLTTWMTAGAAAALRHLGAVPDFGS